MEIEDGRIWVYDISVEGTLAFADFAIESLKELIGMHKANSDLPKRPK